MRRIYLVIAIFLFLLSFICGYYLGCSVIDDTVEITALKRERDSLTQQLQITTARGDSALLIADRHKTKAQQADSIVKRTLENNAKEQKKYQQQIAALKKANVVQLDSFLADRYPDVRPSFNTLTRKITIPEWRAREIAIDLIRLDSVSSLATFQDSIIWQQVASIAHRDTTINAQQFTIDQKSKALELVLQREMAWEHEAALWKRDAQKYKRQRNIVIAGVSVGIGAAALFLLTR